MEKDFITINEKNYSHNDINLIREFFTDAQWDCIYDALSEFQDHPNNHEPHYDCLLYTSPSPRDKRQSRMPSSA